MNPYLYPILCLIFVLGVTLIFQKLPAQPVYAGKTEVRTVYGYRDPKLRRLQFLVRTRLFGRRLDASVACIQCVRNAQGAARFAKRQRDYVKLLENIYEHNRAMAQALTDIATEVPRYFVHSGDSRGAFTADTACPMCVYCAENFLISSTPSAPIYRLCRSPRPREDYVVATAFDRNRYLGVKVPKIDLAHYLKAQYPDANWEHVLAKELKPQHVLVPLA